MIFKIKGIKNFATNLGEAFEMNQQLYKDLEVVPSKEKCLFVITDKNQFNVEEADNQIIDGGEYSDYIDIFAEQSGGTIVFSTDVNAEDITSNQFKNWLLKKYNTFKNRLLVKRTMDKIRKRNNIYCWTIGRYLLGTYTSPYNPNITFNENSLSITLAGVSSRDITKIAVELCNEFMQECVFVTYQPGNRYALVYREPQKH